MTDINYDLVDFEFDSDFEEQRQKLAEMSEDLPTDINEYFPEDNHEQK